jgi:hypothetical protein
MAGKRHGWNGEEIDRIADERDKPITAGLVGGISSKGPKRVAQKFTGAGGYAHGRRACP